MKVEFLNRIVSKHAQCFVCYFTHPQYKATIGSVAQTEGSGL